MLTIRSIPFSEIQEGMASEYSRTITAEDISMFSHLSGDYNPVHLNKKYADETVFGGIIGHGMWLACLISGAIANTIPGPGSIYRSQSLKFLKPIRPGDQVTITLKVMSKQQRTKLVKLDCQVANQNEDCLAVGMAEVIAPNGQVEMIIPTEDCA